MWNAISSGLQAVQDKLDNVIDVTSTQDPSQSGMTTAADTGVTEPHPSVVGGADNKEEVRIVVLHIYITVVLCGQTTNFLQGVITYRLHCCSICTHKNRACYSSQAQLVLDAFKIL